MVTFQAGVTLVPGSPASREAARGVISANCKRTVTPQGALAIMAETMFTSISCHGDLWLHFAVMEN